MEEKDMHRLLMDTSRLKGKQDKEFADSVLEVCFRANRQIIEKLKGDDTMSEALLEIMEPLIEPIIAERIEPMIAERIEPMIAERIEPMIAERIEPIIAERERTIEIRVRKETKEEDIKGLIAILHELGNDDNVIKAALKKQYHLSEEEISKYL